MSTEDEERIQLLQGTLDLIVLRTLATIGPQYAYSLSSRFKQVSGDSLDKSGNVIPGFGAVGTAGLDSGDLGKNRQQPRRKVLHACQSGQKALNNRTERRRRMAGLIEKLLQDEI
jgi:DNA-binding PadR family transcriptional regulator